MDETQCLIGRNVARQFQIAPGGQLELSYLGRSAQLRVAGIIDSGGAEDDQVFANLRPWPNVGRNAGRDRARGN